VARRSCRPRIGLFWAYGAGNCPPVPEHAEGAGLQTDERAFFSAPASSVTRVTAEPGGTFRQHLAMCATLSTLLQVLCRGKCYVPLYFAWALALVNVRQRREP
jgi:hypothetical protein